MLSARLGSMPSLVRIRLKGEGVFIVPQDKRRRESGPGSRAAKFLASLSASATRDRSLTWRKVILAVGFND